jgi:predicted cupin superfamily sugar epimerase
MIGKNAQEWIIELGLEPHPEGGWFRRTYTSELLVNETRPAMTSIYYLLEGGDFSALHRLTLDEQWHFYVGAPLTLHVLNPAGEYTQTRLGPAGPFQTTVPAGHFFGATVESDYALVGCTVAPGFDYADFEMPSRQSLLQNYPRHMALIHRLTRQ